METVIKPILRAKSITTKVTEEECSCLERLAASAGKNMSEWCCEVLLEQVKGANRGEPVLLGELLALRTILLNLLYTICRQEAITVEEMQEIIERAGEGKLRKARERRSTHLENGYWPAPLTGPCALSRACSPFRGQGTMPPALEAELLQLIP